MANIRTVDYKGFNYATGSNGTPGFIIWSGSMALSQSTTSITNYAGVGIEAIGGSESYLRFRTNPEELDIRTRKFFLGSDDAFLSGSGDGTIAISSSNFELTEGGNVTMQGSITAEAGGTIGGWSIGTTALSSSNNSVLLDSNGPYFISASGFQVDGAGAITASAGLIGGWQIQSDYLVDVNNRLKLEPAGTYIISASDFQVTSTGGMSASAGSIAGWSIDDAKIYNTGIHVSSSYGLKVFDGTDDNNDFVEMKYKANDNWGLIGKSSGNVLFALGANTLDGEADNQIAGWVFDNEKLRGGNLTIHKEGSIKSNNYVSNFSGFALTAASGGFLEVENAKIRGTLSTAVFEKETVNAVGGQLYVANSTALTGSVIAGQDNDGGLYAATDTTMSVVNVSGFAADEILSMKRINATGFQTEYVKVNSSSRADASSDTNFSGRLYITRAYGNGVTATAVSQSLGNIPGGAQPYSGSQVIVSTGKIGTGFIRLNANPNDQTTPYIDIVERTGSGIYDLSLKTRLGDLSGINDPSFSDNVTGFGIYTENGYFKGKIEVTNPDGDSMNQNFGGPSGSIVPVTKLVPDGERTGSQWYQSDTLRHKVENGRLLASGSATSTWNKELRSKQTFNRSGDHSFIAEFTILSTTGKYSFLGIGNAAKYTWEGTNPTAAYSNISHGLYFTNDDVSLYEHGAQEENLWITDQFVIGSKYRLKITPQVDGGARYQVWAHPNLSASIGDYTSPADSGNGDKLDWAITPKNDNTKLAIESLQVTAPGQMSTVIEGDKITTGKILSTNWGSSVGSELDLDAGTIKLGGYSNPLFEVDTDGHVSASAGNIAGWTIAANKLSAGTDADYIGLTPGAGIQLGDYTFDDAPFSVTAAGVLKATGATISGDVTVTNPADFALQELHVNRDFQLPNSADNKPAGIKAVYGGSDRAAILNSTPGFSLTGWATTPQSTDVGAGTPAFAVHPDMTYTVVVETQRWDWGAGITPVSTGGFYIRMQELDDALGTNTHVSADMPGSEAGVATATRQVHSASAASGPGSLVWDTPNVDTEDALLPTDITTYTGTYTPTATARWASLVLLNWTDMGLNLLYCTKISIIPTNLNQTLISGNSIQSGKIQSNVVTNIAGSEIDLAEGEMSLGGSIAANSASLEFKNDVLKIRSGSDVTFDSSTAAFDGSNMGHMLMSMRTISPSNYMTWNGFGGQEVDPAGGNGRPGSDFIFNPTDTYLVVLYTAAAYQNAMDDERFMLNFNFEIFDPAVADTMGGDMVPNGTGAFSPGYSLSEAIGKFSKTQTAGGQYDGPFTDSQTAAADNQGFANHAPGMLVIEHNGYDNLGFEPIPLQGMVLRPWLTATYNGMSTTQGTPAGNSDSKALYIEGVTYYGCNKLQLDRMVTAMSPQVTKTYYTGSNGVFTSHKQHHGRYGSSYQNNGGLAGWLFTAGGPQ